MCAVLFSKLPPGSAINRIICTDVDISALIKQ